VALGLLTRAALPGGLALVAALVAWFARRQARPGRIGGALSRPKQVWLFLALGLWFVACPLFALDPAVAAPLRATLGAFVGLMLARAPVELELLCGLQRWTPPMGIAHDALCLVAVLGGLALALAPAGGLPWPPGPADRAALLLLATVAASLVVEVHHAWAFWRLVGAATQGGDAVWFASAEDPRFARINRLTARCNAPLLLLLGLLLLASLAA
jgi:hypothetical protein